MKALAASDGLARLGRRRRLIRVARLAGSVGPLGLGVSICVLSVVQYGFMRSLGWHPLRAPTTDWPSGLALGPYGRLLSAAFVVCGLALPVFASGLAAALDGGRARSPVSKLGTALLAVSGPSMILLASDTDPTFTYPTAHGRLHDAAFALLGLTLLPALALIGLRMLGDARWRAHGSYTLCTVLLATACFLLRGAAFYVFLVAVLRWFVVTALKLQSR